MSGEAGCPHESRKTGADPQSLDPWYDYRRSEEAGKEDSDPRSRIENFYEADMLYDRVPPEYFERPAEEEPPDPST